MSLYATEMNISATVLAEIGLVCPAGGISQCDNGGECGLCLMEYTGPGKYCPYGGHLPSCRPGNMGFGFFCESGGGHSFDGLGYECGTNLQANTCFGGFDIYINIFCPDVPPQMPPPPPVPPVAPPPVPPTPPALPPPALPAPPAPPGGSESSSSDIIIVGAAIPGVIFLLFGLVLLRRGVVRRRKRAAMQERQRAYQVKIASVESEYNSSVLFAVRSLPTFAYGDDAAASAARQGSKGSSSMDECAICMEKFKEGDILKVQQQRQPPPPRTIHDRRVHDGPEPRPPARALHLCVAPLPAPLRAAAGAAVPPHVQGGRDRRVAARAGARAAHRDLAPQGPADLPAVQGGAHRGAGARAARAAPGLGAPGAHAGRTHLLDHRLRAHSPSAGVTDRLGPSDCLTSRTGRTGRTGRHERAAGASCAHLVASRPPPMLRTFRLVLVLTRHFSPICLRVSGVWRALFFRSHAQ